MLGGFSHILHIHLRNVINLCFMCDCHKPKLEVTNQISHFTSSPSSKQFIIYQLIACNYSEWKRPSIVFFGKEEK